MIFSNAMYALTHSYQYLLVHTWFKEISWLFVLIHVFHLTKNSYSVGSHMASLFDTYLKPQCYVHYDGNGSEFDTSPFSMICQLVLYSVTGA